MNTSLEIVVVAIILLVVALVLLTIFGSGITPIANLTSFQNSCRTTGKVSCEGGGIQPVTWAQQVTIGNVPKSCENLMPWNTCCPTPAAMNIPYKWTASC